MPTVYIALGANLGDRIANLHEAVHRLAPSILVERRSPIYETPPWGITEQPAFLNQVVQGLTSLPPHPLLRALKLIEAEMGRPQDALRYGPRLIDLDIVFYDKLVLTTFSLTLPHPRMIERAFVLAPLADLAPDLVHPRLGLTVQALYERVDKTGVVRVSD